MTGASFVGGRARLTGRALAATLFGCALATALIIVLAPLIGVDLAGRLELMDPREVIGGITGPANEASWIFVNDRLPRVLSAAIVGASLAAAGCTFQAALRNPLAEPFTLGVSSGASLAAILAIRLGLDGTFAGLSGTSVAAVLGAGATVYLVWRLGRVGASLPAATLLLAGITIAMFCGAASMLVQYTADFADVGRMVRWMMGGLTWTRYEPLLRAGVPILVGLVVLVSLARDFNALAAGSDAAASVGVDAGRTITLGFVIASLIVGAGIAIGGPIGFVGLIVPHALRPLVGPDHRVLLPASILVGASFLVLCDSAARMAFGKGELPVGVVTALLGGPFFLFILVREKRRGRLWGG